MVYTLDITTPKDIYTPKNPMRTFFPVTRGIVYAIEVEFPPGPLGNLYVGIFDGSFQVWPSSLGQWFHSDNHTIRFDDTYSKQAKPYEFHVYTYNTGNLYPHWCQVRIGMVSKDEFIARYLPAKSFEDMLIALRKMEQEEYARSTALEGAPFPWLV